MNTEKTHDENAGIYVYKYPHPAVTADCVVFGFGGDRLKILLIERGNEPYKGFYALPGGFIRPDETIEQCAVRELMEETGVHASHLTQFRVFSEPRRDSRERVITVAFIALVRSDDITPKGGDDASAAYWFDADALPPLAFDHTDIIALAREHLSEIIRIRPVAFTLLNETFTISELQRVYEAINNTSYDRRNFQRKLLQSGLVEDTGMATAATPSRPATLFKASQTLRISLRKIFTDNKRQGNAADTIIEDRVTQTDIRYSMLKETESDSLLISDDEEACDEEESRHSSKSQTRDLFNF